MRAGRLSSVQAFFLGLGLLLSQGTVQGAAMGAKGWRKQTAPAPRTGPRLPDKLPAAQPQLRDEHLPPLPGAAATEYADSLDLLAPNAAAFERSPESSYSYCIRVTATYEQVYYGPSGKLRRAYVRAIQHGTAFAYRVEAGETFLATNEHVVNMPAVTSASEEVEGVGPGARKVRDSIQIVRSEDDEWAPGFVELKRVMSDPALDLAILKTRQPLVVMPYGMGRSDDLRVGNMVLVRGYPLGVFSASNLGRVTHVRQEDTESDWDHLDFVTDAALSNGHSGSPVLAVSRRTHQLELVGIFHAHYRNANNLGVVVGIDQLREPLLKLSSPRRARAGADGQSHRLRAARLLAEIGRPVFFPFAGLTARATLEPDIVRFEVFDDFPLIDQPSLVLTCAPGAEALELPALSLASSPATPLDRTLQEPTRRLKDELWRSLATALELRKVQGENDGGPSAQRRISWLRRQLNEGQAEQKQILSVVDYESERLSQAPPEAASRPSTARTGPEER
jgi:serine protease Do